jgi:hypothetical protein
VSKKGMAESHQQQAHKLKTIKREVLNQKVIYPLSIGYASRQTLGRLVRYAALRYAIITTETPRH